MTTLIFLAGGWVGFLVGCCWGSRPQYFMDDESVAAFAAELALLRPRPEAAQEKDDGYWVPHQHYEDALDQLSVLIINPLRVGAPSLHPSAAPVSVSLPLRSPSPPLTTLQRSESPVARGVE